MRLRLGKQTYDLSRRILVMAVVNRTPDSFFDQGRTFALGDALDWAMAQVEVGADILDIGGVKAGPGEPVSLDEELERVLPLVEAVRARADVAISVDTFRAEVARRSLGAGADLINDVSGLSEPEVADAVAAHPAAGLVVMHAGGPTRTRPFRPVYLPDATTVVVRRLQDLVAQAQQRGVAADQIVVDPGHDFDKNTYQSLEVTRRLPEVCALGYPVLVALSRKDFIGETLGLPIDERLEGSLAAAVAAALFGARLVRVHDTEATVRALRMVEAILGWRHPDTAIRGLV
jgi:dihydropteroate synthase